MRSGTDRFPNGIHVGEEFLYQVRPDEAHRRTVLLIGLREESPRSDIHVPDFRIVRAHPENIDVFKQIIAVAHIGIIAQQRGDLARSPHAGFQIDEFLARDQRPLLGFHPGIFTGNNSEAVQHVNVGAEVGDAVRHVKIESRNHAHHRHQGHYRQDDSEQGQKAPQLMGAQGVEGEPQRLHHGDQRASKAVQPPCHTHNPRHHPCNSTESFDGGYTQTDLQPSVSKTSRAADSFPAI